MQTNESWHELTARHKREKREMVEGLAQANYTQRQAAEKLGVSVQTLHRYITLNNIKWPNKQVRYYDTK